MSEVAFPPSVEMTLAVGNIDAPPTNGNFKLSYGANTTGELGFAATALQVQTALNALPSIAADGGVTVTKISTTYRVMWNTAVIPASTLSLASNELFPSSSVGINNVRTGSVSVKQVYQIHIKQAPVANITSFVNQSPADATISVIHARAFFGDSSVWRLSIAPEPREGTFLISFYGSGVNMVSNPISINATAQEVALELNDVYPTGLWNCIKTGRYSWDISTPSATVVNLEVNDGGLISFNSKYGVLNLNTAEVEDLLAGTSSVTATMELELFANGTRQTLFQSPVTVLNDLIDNDSYTTVAWGDLMPADSVVRFDTSQGLTLPQQQQARTNIGAIDGSVIAPIQSANYSLDVRLTGLESSQLTNDQKAAINTASTLSALDPIYAGSTIDMLIGTRATAIHLHEIADVTDLQTRLDAKTPYGHTHTVSDITNLNIGTFATQLDLTNGLANKSDTGHSHSTLGTLYVGNLTVPAVSFTDGSVLYSGASLIQDCPSDGHAYIRQNGSWIMVHVSTETINGTVYNIIHT